MQSNAIIRCRDTHSQIVDFFLVGSLLYFNYLAACSTCRVEGSGKRRQQCGQLPRLPSHQFPCVREKPCRRSGLSRSGCHAPLSSEGLQVRQQCEFLLGISIQEVLRPHHRIVRNYWHCRLDHNSYRIERILHRFCYFPSLAPPPRNRCEMDAPTALSFPS